MTTLVSLLAGFAGLSLAAHLASHVLALARLRRPPRDVVRDGCWPPVSLVRPLCGVEEFSKQTLEASFRLTYPDVEHIFCVAQAHDPVVPLVRAAMARHPGVRVRLLIGGELASGNPKLDNMEKGYRAALGDYVVFTDSNLLIPPDYLQHVLGAFTDDAAVVSAPPYGSEPGSFAAEIECGLLNAYAARVQYSVDALGFGFAQGKTLAFRKADLDAGGFAAMALEPAEDAAATKWARAQGRKVRLVTPMAPQPLGLRSMTAVWSRHLRWARLRRATFPLLFVPEILTSALTPFAAMGAMEWLAGGAALPWVAAYAFVWYGADVAATRLAGWPLSWRTLAALPCRDALLAAIWFAAWTGRGFVWHGHAMQAAAPVRPDAQA
jgi:ceramide glucosyltransferase